MEIINPHDVTLCSVHCAPMPIICMQRQERETPPIWNEKLIN